QSELQRFECLLEADDADRRAQIVESAQNCDWISGCAQANVPNYELSRVLLQPLAQLQLADIKRLRLGDRPDHRMKCLVVRRGMDAVNAAGELDEAIVW